MTEKNHFIKTSIFRPIENQQFIAERTSLSKNILLLQKDLSLCEFSYSYING